MDLNTIGTRIKIIGVGGAGCNIVNNMIESNIEGVKFAVVNTDEQDLNNKSLAEEKLALGHHLGAGAKPEIGKEAAEKMKLEIKKMIEGQDMVFITAGMGGGTGTGAAPIVAEIVKAEGVLCVAVVTRPFTFEGPARKRNADIGIEELKKNVDTLIVVPNQKLLNLEGGESKSFLDHLKTSDQILNFGIRSISELITKQGVINLDFADIKTVMKDAGDAIFCYAESNENETVESLVERAITNPLFEREISGSTKMLVNITSGPNLSMLQVEEMFNIINSKAVNSKGGVDNVLFGYIFEPERENVVLSIIATGFEDDKDEQSSGKKVDNMTAGIFGEKKGFNIIPDFTGDDE